MCARISRFLLSRVAKCVVQEFPALAGHAGSALKRVAKAVQFLRDVVERRFHLAPQFPAAIGEEQVTSHPPDDRSDDRCCDSSIIHAATSRTLTGFKLCATSGRVRNVGPQAEYG